MRLCGAAAAIILPLQAVAQLTGTAAATVQYENNSNVFDLNSGFGAPVTGTTRRSDSYYSYGAQFTASYPWRRQEFYATVSAADYKYQHFSELNHTSYNFEGGWNWRLAEAFDGKLDVVRTRNMVPFYNLTGSTFSTTLSLLTEQRETAQINYTLNSRWRLEGMAYTSKSEQPVVNAPDLQLTQNAGTVDLDYLGLGWLTSGITATYLKGHYEGSITTDNPSFTETRFGFLAKYKRTRTTLNGQLGYSHRTSDNNRDSTAGLTGLLEFTDQLTPRTTVTAKAERVINSYVFDAGSEIDSNLSGSVAWQATYKSAFTAGYTFSYRDFPGQGNNPIGSRRVDIQEYVTFGINYQPWRWLLVRPYYNAQTRRSTFVGGHFSATIYGVSVTLQTPDEKRRPR